MDKRDTRQHNIKLARKILEENKGINIFRKNTKPREGIVTLRNNSGKQSTNRAEILCICEEYFRELNKSKIGSDVSQSDRARTIMINVNSEKIAAYYKDEIIIIIHTVRIMLD